jgi:hypothetical protein
VQRTNAQIRILDGDIFSERRNESTKVVGALRDETEHSFLAPRRNPGRGARGARHFSHGFRGGCILVAIN